MASGPMYKVDIDLKPSGNFLVKNFFDMGSDIRATREPLKRSVQEVLAPSFRRNFEVGGRPKWAPLSEATRIVREREGSGFDPLVRTGTLQQVAGQLNIWTIRGYPRSEAFISQLPERGKYGGVHQAGAYTVGNFGPTTIPARPWAIIQSEDAEAIQKVFADYIEERLAMRVQQGGV